ncbi:MAG: hypothetical protein NC305_13285 [Lachnospiraceae bacterium]|nr:hypothetical protein [Butyrivibrio sp.]MCM1344029.1 hypothetical protein [Muribaculaceae bacterium]MCM1411504.1 hypothetical protein [Lachnospiraceae bacterium]
MYGVWFDDMHLGGTADLIMNYARIGTPAAKVKEIEVPGMDGMLDITESLGEVKYNTRQISFKFTTTNGDRISDLINSLHGQRKKIILDRDEAFYYRGRLEVADPIVNGNLISVEMVAQCEPYKYKARITRHKEDIAGASNIVLRNEKMQSIPKITLTAQMRVSFENRIYELPAGEYEIAEIVLKQGYNRFRVEGNGTVLFQYQEGAL